MMTGTRMMTTARGALHGSGRTGRNRKMLRFHFLVVVYDGWWSDPSRRYGRVGTRTSSTALIRQCMHIIP